MRTYVSRITLGELSGSLGDLGLFLPLFLGAHKVGAIQAVPALFWAGAFNVLTGLTWDLPMCVQPMKTIIAAAINDGLTAAEVTVAGMLTSAMVTALGLTRTIELVNRLLPSELVRGIQLGFGLKLVTTAVAMAYPAAAVWAGWAGRGLGVGALVATLAMLQLEEAGQLVPTALVLFVAGMAMAVVRAVALEEPLAFGWGGPVYLALRDVAPADWATGFYRGALPQLPLTTLNSVIAVTQLANDLKPSARVKREGVALSLGVLNLVGCPLGAMPMCHGAGGLAGQWRFGARHGVSVVLLGVLKMAVAVVGGGAFVRLLDLFPTPVLGAMLVFSGIELASAGLRGRHVAPAGVSAEQVREARDASFLCLATAGFVLALGTGLGCLAGLAVAVAQWLREQAALRLGARRLARAPAASAPDAAFDALEPASCDRTDSHIESASTEARGRARVSGLRA
jgi:hypothetical protein